MNISTRMMENVPVVQPAGRIDAQSADRLEEILRGRQADQPQMIVVDLASTQFVSSAGLRVFLRTAQQMHGQGRLLLCGADEKIRELLDLAGLGQLMGIYEDLPSALQSATSPA